MNGYEYMLTGGIPALDGTRSDVYLKEAGPGINEAAGVPLTLELILVSGNLTCSLIECRPEDVRTLGRWLAHVAQEIMDRERSADAGG